MTTSFLVVAALLFIGASTTDAQQGRRPCPNGRPPVNCFVDPCQVNTCSHPGATCRANYCGGCFAEYYDRYGRRIRYCPDGNGK